VAPLVGADLHREQAHRPAAAGHRLSHPEEALA